MPTIRVRDNENERCENPRKNKSKNNRKKEQEGTEAIVKGCELNDHVVHSN